MPEEKDMFGAGLALRREMFGEAGADRQLGPSFKQPFEELITRYCFGEVWGRPPLDRKMRSLLTVAILAVSAKPAQLRAHVRGAVANGATVDEIREVLIHVAIYGGVPSAADSFTHAGEVLAEMGLA